MDSLEAIFGLEIALLKDQLDFSVIQAAYESHNKELFDRLHAEKLAEARNYAAKALAIQYKLVDILLHK